MITLALIGVIGLAFLRSAHVTRRLADALCATETLTASEALHSERGKLVTVRGHARALPEGGPEAAPLSERPCAWWALRVRPLRRWVRGGRLPHLPRELRSDTAFRVTDGAHEVRVEPAGLVSYGHPASERVREPLEGGLSPGPLPALTTRVVRRFPSLDGLVDAGRQRAVELTEWTLDEGAEVAVTGELDASPDSGAVVLRGHRPPRRGRATIFGMTPGQDHTDVSDLRERARRSWWIGGVLTLFGLGILLLSLPQFLGDLASVVAAARRS